MIEVLVSGGIVATFCGLWWNNHSRSKQFSARVKTTNDMLDKFVEVNELGGFVDYELVGETITHEELKKKLFDTSVISKIGNTLDIGYDFFHIKVKSGFTTLDHKHNFSNEFFYVISGEICVELVGGKTYNLKGGDHFYIKKELVHCVTSNVESEFILISRPPMIVTG